LGEYPTKVYLGRGTSGRQKKMEDNLKITNLEALAARLIHSPHKEPSPPRSKEKGRVKKNSNPKRCKNEARPGGRFSKGKRDHSQTGFKEGGNQEGFPTWPEKKITRWERGEKVEIL